MHYTVQFRKPSFENTKERHWHVEIQNRFLQIWFTMYVRNFILTKNYQIKKLLLIDSVVRSRAYVHEKSYIWIPFFVNFSFYFMEKKDILPSPSRQYKLINLYQWVETRWYFVNKFFHTVRHTRTEKAFEYFFWYFHIFLMT